MRGPKIKESRLLLLGLTSCRFDPCNEGAIRVSELRFVMRNLPERLSEEELEELMAAADKDGDGLISFQEFRQMMGQ